MSPARLVPAIVLVPFLAWSSLVTYREGAAIFFTGPFTHPIWTQEFLDLCISLTMVSVWMVADGRRRGARAWPYVLAVPFVGSISPLLYLALRDERGSQVRASAGGPPRS